MPLSSCHSRLLPYQFVALPLGQNLPGTPVLVQPKINFDCDHHRHGLVSLFVESWLEFVLVNCLNHPFVQTMTERTNNSRSLRISLGIYD
jgi:hypothetical protein